MQRIAGATPLVVGHPVVPDVRVDLMGAMRVHGRARPPVLVSRPQVQVTLAFLLVEARPVGRGEIADLLWGDLPLSPHWRGAVRGVLSKVRDVFARAGVDAAIVGSSDGTVRLQVPAELATDLGLGEEAVARAEAALVEGQASAAHAAVAPWLEHLQQDLLPAGDGAWVRSVQARAAGVARRAVLAELEARLAMGHTDVAADLGRWWVGTHPSDEQAHELLITGLVDAGRSAEAQQAYRAMARGLADELGIAPSDRIARLVRDHLRTVTTSDEGVRSVAERPLLGRQKEVQRLSVAWARTVDGRMPRLAVISGRSGIGKTRLAEELADVVRRDGGTIRWARCLPGDALPFEPLATAVQPDSTTPSSLNGPLAPDPSTARASALRAISQGMRDLASTPAALIIDDFQWADDDLASALEQTLAAVAGPLMVVVIGRDLPPSLAVVLGRLQRSLPGPHVRLRELTLEDLVRLFPAQDRAVALAEAEALHRSTGGHPFFVSEVALVAQRTGSPIDPDDVSEGVRDWLEQRADALEPGVRACLDVASVIGETSTTAAVARCLGIDPDDALGRLEDLVAEGLLVDTGRVDEFAFAHLITRNVVYEGIGTTRRARMHASVAGALAAGPPAPGQHAAIADHLRRAGPAHAEEAGRHLLLAGREALDSGAWSLAERFFRGSREVAGDDPTICAGALTGLARALHLQRRRSEAEALIGEALAIARAYRLSLEFAEAVLVLVGRAGRGATQHLDDLEQAALLREALSGLESIERRETFGPASRSDQVRLASLTCHVEGELALAIALTAPADERRLLTERAVARARSLDPPDTHLTARALLIARLARLDLGSFPARIDDLDQVLAIAPAGRSIDATLAALTYRAEDLAVCGRRSESRRALSDAVALAVGSEHPYWTWATATWRGLEALIDGDLEEAERRAVAASRLEGVDERGASACLGVNLVNIRLYQGRSAEVLDLLAAAAEASPHIPCYRAVHALCAVSGGEPDRALGSFEHFRADGFSSIPEDSNRLLTLTVLADTAVQLEDRPSIPALRELLLPAADLHAILNCYGGGGAYWGPVAHQLARLAALEGDRAEADRWYLAAEAGARRMESAPALARIMADPVRSSR